MDTVYRRILAELNHVEAEIVVGDLPRRIEHERRSRNAPISKLRNCITDFTAAAPDVGRDPRTEGPRRRQRWTPRIAGVTRQYIGEFGTVDNVEAQGREVVDDDVAVWR